jgi:hypothetical protein
MKLGLDIHNCIDKNPKEFIKLAKCGLFTEAHIITGVPITDKVIEQLKGYNEGKQWWSHLVGIEDELMKIIPPEGYNEKDRPYWDDYTWNSFKGKYCNDNKIDLHFDDTEAYAEYFIESRCVIFK